MTKRSKYGMWEEEQNADPQVSLAIVSRGLKRKVRSHLQEACYRGSNRFVLSARPVRLSGYPVRDIRSVGHIEPLPDTGRPRPSPYWGYTYNPYASTLRGIASVGHAQANIIRAQGEFLVNREQAALVREQVRVAKLETRKKELEHWEWEREFKAGALERERDRIRAVEVDRSRKFPPASEILAATALNALLNELKAQPALPGDSTPIEPEWLAHIHVASPAGGHLGLLKHDRIHWPLMLRTSEFKNERENVESLIEQARRDAANKGLTGEEILLLRQLLSSLQRRADTATRSGIAGASWSPQRQYPGLSVSQ